MFACCFRLPLNYSQDSSLAVVSGMRTGVEDLPAGIFKQQTYHGRQTGICRADTASTTTQEPQQHLKRSSLCPFGAITPAWLVAGNAIAQEICEYVPRVEGRTLGGLAEGARQLWGERWDLRWHIYWCVSYASRRTPTIGRAVELEDAQEWWRRGATLGRSLDHVGETS